MTRQSKAELTRLIEEAMRQVGRFHERGVWLCVQELVAIGQPIDHIHVWATLHFLPLGSPFDSGDADLWVWPLKEQAEEWLRREMRLRQPIQLHWENVDRVVHDGVIFTRDGGHKI